MTPVNQNKTEALNHPCVCVVTHKPYWMPESSLYLPVCVGSAKDSCPSSYQRDNQGENISDRNPYYCELTALYWAWKNLDAPVIGLAHYRRHFKGAGPRGVMTETQAADLLGRYDVLVPRRRNYVIQSVYNHYTHAHHAEPLDKALEIIQRDYPDMMPAAHQVMNRTWLYLYNMFLMPRETLDAYCTWLFPILFEVEVQVDVTEWSDYERRAFGFLAERLFNIWLTASDLNIGEVPCVFLEKVNWPRKAASFLARLGKPRQH